MFKSVHIHPNMLSGLDCEFLSELKSELQRIENKDKLAHVSVFATVYNNGAMELDHIVTCGRDEVDTIPYHKGPMVWVKQYLAMYNGMVCRKSV